MSGISTSETLTSTLPAARQMAAHIWRSPRFSHIYPVGRESCVCVYPAAM